MQNQEPNIVYKVRVPNRDAQRGTSGGYRVIYYLKTAERIVLLKIYSKSDQENISAEEVRALIDEVEPENGEPLTKDESPNE